MAAGRFILTWTGDPIQDDVFSWELTQAEGEFAALTVEVKNPHVGFLSGELDATLQWDSGSGLVDLFAGRLVGAPQSIQNEVVSLSFLARPEDFDEQKAALAESLKVAPFYDPIFVDPQRVNDPDVVLEARPQLWHIDRVTHEVTVSDIIEGEDGLLDLADDIFYDSLDITYNDPPATTVNCTCELSWKQQGSGEVDLSAAIEQAFADAGYYQRGLISSYTGGGLITSWPKPNQSIGGGWKVGSSSIKLDEVAETGLCTIRVQQGGFRSNSNTVQQTYILVTNADEPWDPLGIDDILDDFLEDGTKDDHSIPKSQVPSVQAGCTTPNWYGASQQLSGSPAFLGGASTVGFQLWLMRQTLTAQFTADRARKETVTFSFNAGVQPLVSSSADNTIEVKLATSQVDQPVDPGGVIPIADLRRRSYMLTDRGHQTLEYLIVYCRAKLLARARAVTITFETPFENVADLTLRHSVSIADPRIPGGVASGKVTNLEFSLSGDDGALKAKVTMACTIGTAGTLPALPTSTGDTYASGYSTDYTATGGGGTALASGDIQYENYDATTITDDGLDLVNMTAAQAILSLVVVNGCKRQEDLLTNVTYASSASAIAMLNENCTKVALALRPVTNTNTFETAFPINVSDLIVPKTLDLEAS